MRPLLKFLSPRVPFLNLSWGGGGQCKMVDPWIEVSMFPTEMLPSPQCCGAGAGENTHAQQVMTITSYIFNQI